MALDLFIKACESGDISLLRKLKTENPNFDILTDDGVCILETFMNGHTRILKELIEMVDDYRCIINTSNISTAINNGQVKIVKYIMNTYSFFDYDIVDLYMSAVGTDNLPIVRFIIEEKKMINVNNESIRDLQIACGNGSKRVVKYLLGQGANPNQNEGWPILYATRNCNNDIVKILVEKGADYKVRNNLAYKTAQRMRNNSLLEYFDSLESGD